MLGRFYMWGYLGWVGAQLRFRLLSLSADLVGV